MILDIFETISRETEARVTYLLANARDDVTVRINSGGGEIVPALSIYNQIKEKKCNVEILGLAASAASMIACAGVKVSAAANSLFMIHALKTMLIDHYSKQDLDKLSNTLSKYEESVLMAYRTKVANFQMPNEEIWLSAAEAKSIGFVDTIIDEVPITMNAGMTFINSIAYDVGKVKGLAERLHPTPKTDAALEQVLNLIKDQMQSGAQWVGSQTPPTPEEMRIKKLVAYANGVI
ncbi:MAG: Clp protease ClpP [Quinella sp. 1Q5]|nr:Clp protease ClpP [Quinella sp. 1Q5]